MSDDGDRKEMRDYLHRFTPVYFTPMALDNALQEELGHRIGTDVLRPWLDEDVNAGVVELASDGKGYRWKPGQPRESMLTMISMMGLYEELDWLRDHGALAGVVAIMRERRHQIEEGYTPGHDREHHGDGWLLGAAHNRLQAILDDIGTEAASPASELGEMATAAALAAAEIDRLEGDKS